MGRGGLVSPINAPGAAGERAEGAILAAQKEPPAGNRGLAERGRGVRKPESPFQFQRGHLLRRQAGKWLEARVREVHSPTVPDGAAAGLRGTFGARAGVRFAGSVDTREEPGDGAALAGAQ